MIIKLYFMIVHHENEKLKKNCPQKVPTKTTSVQFNEWLTRHQFGI